MAGVYEATHLGGKRHRKLSGGDSDGAKCWVWVDRPEEGAESSAGAPERAPTAAELAALAAAADNDPFAGAWETVDAATRKREARVRSSKNRLEMDKGKESAAASKAAERPLPVHRRCDACGVRARDGATIQTDPDETNRAYCSPCWKAYLHPEMEEEAGAPAAPEPRKHVTKWNRDD